MPFARGAFLFMLKSWYLAEELPQFMTSISIDLFYTQISTDFFTDNHRFYYLCRSVISTCDHLCYNKLTLLSSYRRYYDSIDYFFYKTAARQVATWPCHAL